MLYNGPVGGGANDPFVDYDPVSGQQGSKVPAKAIEYTQRELVNLFIEAGVTPTNTDIKQLMRTVRSGLLTTYADGGTPNSIVLTSVTPHAAYVPGQVLAIKLANDITGPTQIKLDGLSTLPVVYPGGTSLQRFDFRGGDIVVGRVNPAGTFFIVLTPINQQILDSDVVRTVYGANADFPDVPSAMAWLNRRRIAFTGRVFFRLAAGVGTSKLAATADWVVNHPDSARLFIEGQPISGALPAGGAMQITGYGTATRQADTTVNLATLRNRFNTEIGFTGGFGIRGSGQLGGLTNILFTSDGVGASVDLMNWQAGAPTFTNVAFIGSGFRGICAFGARIALAGTCYVIGNALHGMTAEGGGTISLTFGSLTVALSNGGKGVYANAGSIAPPSIASGIGTGTVYAAGNADDGVNASNNGSVTLPPGAASNTNGGCGFRADNGGRANVDGSGATGNAVASYAINEASMTARTSSGSGSSYAYQAIGSGTLVRTGGTATGTVGTASPPIGQVGNGNAYIV